MRERNREKDKRWPTKQSEKNTDRHRETEETDRTDRDSGHRKERPTEQNAKESDRRTKIERDQTLKVFGGTDRI